MTRFLCTSAVCLIVLTACTGVSQAETIARCGAGWLEVVDGYPVLHLKGSPYEVGFQHGALLKESVTENLNQIINVQAEREVIEIGPLTLTPRAAIEMIVAIEDRHVPDAYFEELQGLSDGSGLDLEEVRIANFIPELFHCSGFALMNSATKDGTLYHGRVLDYATGWGLQNHAVIIVTELDGCIPFVNVSYAGFIGCVTGMNAEHVSIGEMGGGGIGHWEGMPMAFLVREALQRGHTLQEVLDIYEQTPRTCEYFYVVADAKTNEAIGMEASWDVMDVIQPGTSHTLLPHAVNDCALLSAGSRYEELVQRVQAGHGTFTPETALHLMDRPVAMRSNLHNVLFEPATTRLWVSNAGPDGEPAAERPYHTFQLSELLERTPTMDAPEIVIPVASVE